MPMLLSEEDVRIVLSMEDLIAAMRTALEQFSTERVEQPLRSVIEVGLQKAAFAVMPAFVTAPPALGAKLVTVFPSNSGAGLPTHLATILLLDPMTGELVAIMDGRYITEARTAAVSAVSTDLLAREDASVLAVIGSGVQARSHVDAIGRVRDVRTIRAWSPTPDRLAQFIREIEPRTSAQVVRCSSAREAVNGADVVVLATSAREPVVRGEWIREGTHICAVGACRPDQREMPGTLVARSRLFVDSRAGAHKEAGDLLLAINEGLVNEAHVAGELGELVLGRVGGRRTEEDVTIFKSLGMAVEDVVAAQLVLERATTQGLGVSFSLS